ncbi:hypothetical protein [Acidomonas methanolica]|uniref:hypothetical protein n=1 Tax=Acidomonas methanolica TaxID=437 RepID=UPI002119CDD9|nr:hypothetical protein [Acidomonas methanolica]MCQ9156082.1 hypothetical protein [Acidomonas methanolica]
MSDNIDPKELKILSDILALVLDEQAGQAVNALEAVRNRARRNAVTAGALKNLFVAIAPNPPRARATRTRAASGAAARETQDSRQRIMTLTEDLRRLDLDLRTSRARVEQLRTELHLTQAARAEIQTQLANARAMNRPLRMSVIWLACLVGLLLGIAGTQFVHTLLDAPPVDKSIYLH